MKYATGVTFYEGDLYFSEINNIWKIENIDQHLEQSMALPPKILVTNNLPSNPWHGWKWIDFGPDGYLYLADSNFGMHRRDSEIAQKMRDARDNYGWPRSVWATWAKNSNEKSIILDI